MRCVCVHARLFVRFSSALRPPADTDYSLNPSKINKFYKLGAKPGDVAVEWASKVRTSSIDVVARARECEFVFVCLCARACSVALRWKKKVGALQ